MKHMVFGEREVDKSTEIICDQDIRLIGVRTSAYYLENIRMVSYKDYATGNAYRFITNDFTLPALTIAELYRERWTVECFFKWIKGRIYVKSFYRTSQNAVYTQIEIAVCTYLLLIIAKKEFHVECELCIWLNP